MRLTTITLMIFAVLLSSCNSASDKKNADRPPINVDTTRASAQEMADADSAARWLIEASAGDFTRQRASIPAAFRKVQIRYAITPDSLKQYLLCGELLSEGSQGKDEWIPFATIKTSAYEQWIGSQALGYCNGAKIVSYLSNDYSSALQRKIDSLQESEALPR